MASARPCCWNNMACAAKGTQAKRASVSRFAMLSQRGTSLHYKMQPSAGSLGRLKSIVAHLVISKPDPSEYAPYYGKYITLVPGDDVLAALADQLAKAVAKLRSVSEGTSLRRYAPDKWRLREGLR